MKLKENLWLVELGGLFVLVVSGIGALGGTFIPSQRYEHFKSLHVALNEAVKAPTPREMGGKLDRFTQKARLLAPSLLARSDFQNLHQVREALRRLEWIAPTERTSEYGQDCRALRQSLKDHSSIVLSLAESEGSMTRGALRGVMFGLAVLAGSIGILALLFKFIESSERAENSKRGATNQDSKVMASIGCLPPPCGPGPPSWAIPPPWRGPPYDPPKEDLLRFRGPLGV